MLEKCPSFTRLPSTFAWEGFCPLGGTIFERTGDAHSHRLTPNACRSEAVSMVWLQIICLWFPPDLRDNRVRMAMNYQSVSDGASGVWLQCRIPTLRYSPRTGTEKNPDGYEGDV